MVNTTCSDSFLAKNEPLAVGYIIQLLIYLPFYVPCFIVMCRHMRENNTYKIMIVLGVYDMVVLIATTVAMSYWCVIGLLLDPHTYLPCEPSTYLVTKVFGAFANGVWLADTVLCALLGVNRAIELSSAEWGERLFDGKKIFIWIAFPIIWQCIGTVMFLTPCCSSIFNPILGFYHLTGDYGLTILRVNNLGNISLIFLSYAVVLWQLRKMTANISPGSDTPAAKNIRMRKRQAALTSMAVSVVAGSTMLSYTTLPLFTQNPLVYNVMTFVTQNTLGCNGVIYFALNTTIREKVKEMLGFTKTNVVAVAPAPQP